MNSFRKVQTSKEMKNALKTKPKQAKQPQSGQQTLYLLSIGADALDKVRLRLSQRLHQLIERGLRGEEDTVRAKPGEKTSHCCFTQITRDYDLILIRTILHWQSEDEHEGECPKEDK